MLLHNPIPLQQLLDSSQCLEEGGVVAEVERVHESLQFRELVNNFKDLGALQNLLKNVDRYQI